jgi:hypothetical protein
MALQSQATRANTSATTTQRGHHLPAQPHVGHPPTTCPGRIGGATCAYLLLPLLPRPADRCLALDQLPWSPRQHARRPSLCACHAAAQVCRRHSCQPRAARRTTIPPRQARFGQRRPSRSPTTATRQTRLRPTWPVPRHRRVPGSSAMRTARLQRPRTPDACLSGHPHHTGRVDTGRVDSGVCPTGWTDLCPHGGQRMRTERWTAWPMSGHPGRPRRRRPPAGRRNPLGLQRLRRSATDDGSAVTTPAAAVTGQLRSTARHEAAPRRTAVVCWSWRVRGEGNGTTERRGVRGQVGRDC